MNLKFIRKYLASFLLCSILAHCTRDASAQVTGGAPQTSLPTTADGGNLGSGKLNFQPDLFTGRFTYTVPIAVPPGRQNSQPKLGLLYNSSVGNGWCGVGWKFEIGKIERETRYGVPAAPQASQYDDSKSFTVDFGGISGHLVQISPSGQSPVQYRLQVDKSFLTFLYYNNVANAYWSVIDKNGVQYFFGESTTNRLDDFNLPANGFGGNTFRWALDRIVDANGNATYFTYTNQNYQLYPLRISYNANVNSPTLPAVNTIDFVLTNRTDRTVGFISNFRIENDNRLSQIIVKANGQPVCRYVLGYSYSASTSRSLLTSVTEYGNDDVSSLPPVTFSYQVQQPGFGPLQSWGGVHSQGGTGADWNSIKAVDGNGNTYVNFIDMDGDGLPDRVMRMTNSPYNAFIVQRNTGSNFVGNYVWGGLTNQGNTNAMWGNVAVFTNSITSVDFFDVNGDGKPDRVMTNFLSSNCWTVQLNGGPNGSNSFVTPTNWATLASGYPDIHSEQLIITNVGYYGGNEEMIDLNGDGLVDRVFGRSGQVQFNTGNGFGPITSFGNLSYSEYQSFGGVLSAIQLLTDLNGDGLPDVIYAASVNGGKYGYNVLHNDGAGMEFYGADLGDLYTNLNAAGGNGNMLNLSYVQSGVTMLELMDINGDGLPDRVMTKQSSPYNTFRVQLNNGSDFGPLINWTNVQSKAGTGSQPWDSVSCAGGYTTVAFVDINGDGLPDRVMCSSTAPYTNFWVQLNLGPYPDLLNSVNNGLGGSVQVTYQPSTSYDNTDRSWTNDPWAEGAKSLLPFPVYTVASITVNDGMRNTATNTYSYKHGFFDSVSREFRGFNRVAVTDPYGAQTVTYFHQSGGFNDATNGEFQDQGTFSKKGMPYRVETWGTNGLLYQLVLNKVQEYVLNTNGWYFPCVTQTVVMNYEGLGSYRATAVQFSYDTNTENLVKESDYGEVGSIVLNGQTFSDIGNDSVFKWITYTNIGSILNRPSDTTITSDSAGASRLRETLNSYDTNGNLKLSESWLDTAGAFITTVSNNFDQYGNVKQTSDAAGITTTITYDPTYQQFPTGQAIGSFSSSSAFDNRSGQVLTNIDIKGLVSLFYYDAFFRPTASYISTNAYGTPNLWQTKTTYNLGGIGGGNKSQNYIENQVNDTVGLGSGFITYTYTDGLGRTVETRAEAETGQYRVANVVYDQRGNPFFSTLSYFSSGTAYTVPPQGAYLGSLTEYDSIGRAFRSTPAVNGVFAGLGILSSIAATGGDSGSPVGGTTNAFVDGSNPWATVTTDPLGKIRKSYRDAYGRTIQSVDIASSGNVTTSYAYDLLGNLTNVTDNANNSTVMGYDSLGRKTSMVDPDMGTWSYVYDNASRLVQQTDARTNTIEFFYNDPLGRLTSKQIYNPAGARVGTATYAYDTSSGDPNYTVYPGQLYKVTDLQGYQRSSYDVRGRVLKSARFLNVNAMEYVTQATYDDADRVQQLIYPGGAATIQYSYDIGGNLSQVASLAGTGTNVTFYTPRSFNALGQLTGYTNGNGVITAYAYYQNSLRLQNLATSFHGTNYQNLSYTYDKASDVTGITDNVNPSGSASASVGSITYDDLYRVTSLNSTARGAKAYAYNSIGNLLTNLDNGSGLYQYGAKPHAVTGANGITYGYDACGNITNRGSQMLAYDAQNQLIQVANGTNDSVAFGYDDSGERLWRAGTNGYTIWIGGVYEINNGKVLCHVIAGGQLIATFEPQCNAGLSKVFGEKNWYVASTKIGSMLTWPFQNGRGQWTVFGGTWVGILGVCMIGGRRIRLKRYEIRKAFRLAALWRQTVTFTCISAFLWASTGDVEAATYTPVFYYYHTDHLGSSNVLTDRSGNLVQHYEYATFGLSSYQNNTSAFPISNRYTGQTADDETGLLYYGGRYYDPQLGRFIQPDPTVPDPEDSQSFNQYSYCRNNPLNEIDPSGFDDYSGDGSGYYTFGNYGYGYSGFDGNGNFFATWTWWSSPINTSLDYTAINNSWGNVSGSSSFSTSGFDTLGNAFNGFASVPNTTVAPQPGGSSSGDKWLTGIKAGLTAASLAPGLVGSIASGAQAGLDLIQGNYVEAGIDTAGIALSFIGLGVAAKAIKLAREARIATNAEALAVDTAKVGKSLSKDYRATFFAANPELEGNVIVHHAAEQQVLTRYPGLFTPSEIHSLENLRGIPNEFNSDLHLSQIRREWNQFYRANPNPTREQILQQATKIDVKYGAQFLPPVQ